MPKTLIDNDILSKCVIFSLLNEMVVALSHPAAEIGVLGVARYVISAKRLGKALDGGDRAHGRLLSFLDTVELLEPTDDESGLAAELEALAIKNQVDLDIGESQLCAIAITRIVDQIYTGDKRAIAAIEQLRDSFDLLSNLDQKLVCLEALIITLISIYGHALIRNAIYPCRGTDKALDICFQCHNDVAEFTGIDEGLRSYLNAVLRTAPRVSKIF
jgi:hypothetical protein